MSPVSSVPKTEVIERQPLREQVRRVVLRRILQGELSGGANLNEAQLAEDLGVSRTPVREALMQLEQEGFLVSEPGRGFFVAPLSALEVRDLFPLIGVLEGTALRWAGSPPAESVARLEAINSKLAEVGKDPEAALSLNGQWHRLLVAHCDNQRLRGMIEQLRRQAYRYEYNYFMPGIARTGTAVGLHQTITDQLHRGDVEAACTGIDQHWLTDLDLMLPQVEDV